MTTSTRDAEAEAFETELDWQSGAVAGALAAVAMGIVISILDVDVLRQTIAGLYGMGGSLVFGWIAHVIHGVIFGVVFAVVFVDPALHPFRDRYGYVIVLGAIYGLILAAAASGIVMPIWLNTLGLPDAPPIPFITLSSVFWHVVYGGVLGAVFDRLSDV